MLATTRTLLSVIATCAALLVSASAAHAYDASCPAGKVMTGIEGKLGGYLVLWTVLGQVQPVCRSLTAEGSWVDDESLGTPGGTGTGDSWSLDCNPNHGVTGISGMKADVIDSIAILCSPIPTWMRAGSNWPGMGYGPEGGDGGNETYSDSCSSGFGRSLTGDEGAGVINTIGLECGSEPWGAVRENPPTNYFPEDQQTLANLIPEFKWQLIVNAHNYHLCVTSDQNGQPCDALDKFTLAELQAGVSQYQATEPLSMGDANWGSWKVQACNGAGVCGAWSQLTSFLAPGGQAPPDAYDPNCSCNTDGQCQQGCACDGDCPCIGNDVTFFGNGTSGDLCSVYKNIRCQNCHSETFRERDTDTPPVGNHFPNEDAENEICTTCHIKDHPGEWFTPASQLFEKPCFNICEDLQAWSVGHDLSEHLSTGFDPRIKWSFDPSGFSPDDLFDTTNVPAVTEMTYDDFISTSQDWITDGMCCAAGANGSGARVTRPDDRPGGGGSGDEERKRRQYLKWLDRLPTDFRRTRFPKIQIDPPRPDPRYSGKSLRKATDPSGKALSMNDRAALLGAGLRADASRSQVEKALASMRRGTKVDPRTGRSTTGTDAIRREADREQSLPRAATKSATPQREATKGAPQRSATRAETTQQNAPQRAAVTPKATETRVPVVRDATSGGRRLDHALSLEPAGGKAVSVTLSGSNLDQVRSVRVLREGRAVRDLDVRIQRKTSDALDLEIRAASGAQLDARYEIELETSAGRVAVPPQTFKMKVRGEAGGSRSRR